MEAGDLARWTRFALRGGIGICTALHDCVAQGADDLMFLKDDQVVVLLQLPQEDQYLGYCEGVVGRFHGSAVRFHSKLKKPVFAKRQSAAGSASSISPTRPISLSPGIPPAPPPASSSNSHSSLSSTPNSDTKPVRVSVPYVSPTRDHPPGPSHSRTASIASSSSHYSTRSRPPSRPTPTHAHTASSESTICDFDDAQQASRRSPAPTTTPSLTDVSSAPSSSFLTPTPALSALTSVPPSQSRVRPESEKISPRQETLDIRPRSGSENSTAHVRRSGEEHWYMQTEGKLQGEDISGKTSFKTVSVYSEVRGVLHEESEEEVAGGRTSVSDQSDLSDGAFGIGMTLLREDDDDDESIDDEQEEDGDEDMTLRHSSLKESNTQANTRQQLPRTPRTLAMRVMNPSIDTETETDNETSPEDDTVTPAPSTTTVSTFLASSTTSTSAFPASSSAEETALSDPSSPQLGASSAPASDEDWASDADIYDDYRYSRASFYSPLHSGRASKASARTRPPPLPDGGDGRKSMSRSSTSTAVSRKSAPRPATPPPPPQENRSEVAAAAMSAVSPLTRAFRHSDESMYSRHSEDNKEDHETFVAKMADGIAPGEDAPALAPMMRERVPNETREDRGSLGRDVHARHPPSDVRPRSPATDKSPARLTLQQPPLRILTVQPADKSAVIILSESPTSIAPSSPPSRSRSPSRSPTPSHLRVTTPVSYGSAPPSPLNPSYPPSPSALPPTAPLTINKNPSPAPSPTAPRFSAVPPAIPVGGVLSPGQPPPHPNTYRHHQRYTAVPAAESLHSALRLAGQQHARTIHGHVQVDLLAASGPVPISFVLPGMAAASRPVTMPAPPSPDALRTTHDVQQPPPSPLPRANFFPKVGQVRPRSRSFSGFNSEITEMVSQTLARRSQDEGANGFPFPRSTLPSRTPTALAPSPVMLPPRGKLGQAARPSHGPSPLSLPPTTNNHPASSVRSLGVQAQDRTPPYTSLRQTQTPPTPQMRHASVLRSHTNDDTSSLRPPSPIRSSPARLSQESDRTHPRSDVSTPPNGSPSPSSLVQGGSLRPKISIPAMRVKTVPRGGASETSPSMNGPVTPTDEETVQIKDMEFELVRPTVVRASSDLYRGDTAESKEGLSVSTADLRHDSSSSRSEALSPGGLSPATDVRLRSANASPDPIPPSRRGKGVESVQAHRERELKWISTINSSGAAQARKSKKIKKLLIEGVPSSVRYLVWAHLSDSGSKKMPAVYAQLSKRRPAFVRDIERDVEQSFPGHQHLRDPNGPLVSVLCAYIAMVPDLRYHRGLAIIAGNLLLQSPEEDAFWTFLAMMDSHLRPYFMPTSPQMGVDISLFVKAVEAAEPQLAKRLFAEFGVRPQDLCGMWFSSVFAVTLPPGHLHRVWDLFFYEGVPFLFRVGLTILSLSQRYLFESPRGSSGFYTTYLLHLPPDALPADPEQFISQALSVKLKDDDIRKMRVKMSELAVKKQRAPRMSAPPSHSQLAVQAERLRAQ